MIMFYISSSFDFSNIKVVYVIFSFSSINIINFYTIDFNMHDLIRFHKYLNMSH